MINFKNCQDCHKTLYGYHGNSLRCKACGILHQEQYLKAYSKRYYQEVIKPRRNRERKARTLGPHLTDNEGQ